MRPVRSYCRYLFGAAVIVAALAAATMAQELKPSNLASLQTLIKPQPGEAHWREVDWMPSTNIWAARQQAAKARKPILLWYMAGEPLGTC
jgi:hypothetical protein